MTSNVPSSRKSLRCCVSENRCRQAVDLGLSVAEHLKGPAAMRAGPAAPSRRCCWLLSRLRARGWREPSLRAKGKQQPLTQCCFSLILQAERKKMKSQAAAETSSLRCLTGIPASEDTEPKSLFSPRVPPTRPGPPRQQMPPHPPGTEVKLLVATSDSFIPFPHPHPRPMVKSGLCWLWLRSDLLF